jgi:hypothetical protein
MMITIYVNFSKEEVLNEQQFEELKEKSIPLFEEDMDSLDEWLTKDYSAAEILYFSESQKTELLKEWKKTCVNYVDDYLCDEGWQEISLEI